MNARPLAEASTAIWPTLLHTPLGDLLRGRLTGRLGIGSVLTKAALPEPLAGLIYQVARRTRLWRVERVDVARELAEHFRDGLAGGRTPEQLVESFGDVKQAARLIRRAKLRARPLFWRMWRRGVQALAAIAALVVGCYLLLAIRLFAHHPTIAHNYGLDLIAPTQGVAEADRAWPFYRQALLHRTPVPVVVDESNLIPGQTVDAEPLPDQPVVPLDYTLERPGSRYWERIERWLDENQIVLAEIRQGAAKARFGFVYGDPANRAWLKSEKFDPKALDPKRNDDLIGFLLPQQQAVRHLGQLLELDALRALAGGDRKAFLHDVDAMIKMAEQLEGDMAFLVVNLISYSIFERALILVDEMLVSHPEIFHDEDFAHLAHQIASYAGGGQLIPRLAGERANFHDLIQRIYSDDGHGDGTLTYEGLKLLRSYWGTDVSKLTQDKLFDPITWVPVAGAILPRREITELGDAMYDRAEAEFQRPLWQDNDQDIEQDLVRWSANPVDQIRYSPLLLLLPSIKGCYYPAQRLTQNRDASLVALALTVFHRRHGAWPERLDELVPDLLPTIPADRYTGEPIRYRVVDGNPRVYSVGPDKVDNGGEREEGTEHAVLPPGSESIGSDWILWKGKAGGADGQATAESK